MCSRISTRSRSRPATAGWQTLARGFALQAANPNALVFFVALLPQFINPDSPVARLVAILGATSVAIEFLVLAAYGYLAGRATAVARQPWFVILTNRMSDGLLIGAGVGVALSPEG